MCVSRSILDPLFNKRVFAAVCLCMCVAAAFLLWPERTTRESQEEAPAPMVARDPQTAYQRGFNEGFDAFLKQTNQYTPRPLVVTYTRSEENEAGDDEEVNKGYVDGYHKATELQNCPRSNYEY